MQVPPDSIERLSIRVDALEQRIHALEHPFETPVLAVASEPIEAPPLLPADRAGGIFPLFGKAMLGIAGAYLLRAVAESGSVPKLAVAALAFAYAAMWLVWATRVAVEDWLASTTYAGTSALILAPMLWELTLRFKVLPTSASAVVLCVYVLVATALCAKHNRSSVLWITNATASIVALGLLIATHDLAPFVAALVGIVLIGEIAELQNHRESGRPLVAVIADVAVWAMISIYSAPQSSRMDYCEIAQGTLLALGAALFVVYAASGTIKTILLGQRITIFEIAQTMVAFVLAAVGMLRFGSGWSGAVLGGICLLFSATGYALTYIWFDRREDQRNAHVYSGWSAALFLVACLLMMTQHHAALVLALAAVVGSGLSRWRLALGFHALVYLVAAVFSSGLLGFTLGALVGSFPSAPTRSIWAVTICAILCYACGLHIVSDGWPQRLLHLVEAILAIGAVTALLLTALVSITALRITPGVHHIDLIRTLTTCAVALALAYSGSRWKRKELAWMAYGTLVFVGGKLVLEDALHGHLEFIAASIFFYALTFILLPRLVKLGQCVENQLPEKVAEPIK